LAVTSSVATSSSAVPFFVGAGLLDLLDLDQHRAELSHALRDRPAAGVDRSKPARRG
jgi:hypothetical protein